MSPLYLFRVVFTHGSDGVHFRSVFRSIKALFVCAESLLSLTAKRFLESGFTSEGRFPFALVSGSFWLLHASHVDSATVLGSVLVLSVLAALASHRFLSL